jgi:hypothetical protein
MKINDILNEGKSPHKKGTAKYKKHMAAMHAESEENKDDYEHTKEYYDRDRNR